jgi:hypothetical protein
MRLKYKQATGERVFGHHTADEPTTAAEQPWAGVSLGAVADPRSTAVREALGASPAWAAVADYLGEYRLVVGQELSGKPLAMVACKDGRTYEIQLLDSRWLDNSHPYYESAESIAGRLTAEVENAKAYPKLSRLERFLRFGRKGIE